jgi:DNA-binding winged helix-turn-helix (wHTH) protein/predicted ATPase
MKRTERSRSELVSLDVANARLHRGRGSVALRPKDLSVLHHLAERPGRLVPKDALMSAAWPGVFVTEAVLKACINRLRAALGDDAREPRFIETVHRRGYRLVGEIALVDRATAGAPTGQVVGRDAELDHLDRSLRRALAGGRQVLLVSGEAGLGKTTLVDLFLGTRLPRGVLTGRGQCVEHYGSGEAYMPVLEALGGLCRGPEGRTIVNLLARHAPSWLAQMPGLVTPRKGEEIRRLTLGVTRERMLRELAGALEILTRATPLVLVLEDLHWSDVSTLDVIATVARRREPARLLLIATYRPEEPLPDDHPLQALVRELRVQRCAVELVLPLLGEAAVRAYLAARFAGAALPSGFAEAIHRRTEGHPLFLVAMAEHLGEARGGLDALERVVPADVRHMIEARLERLTAAERRLVEAASVVGEEFSAASVAAALEAAVAEADERCAALARRRFLLRSCGHEAWPDGTKAGRYGFVHALYRELTYEQVPVARRIELHRRVASREEAGHGSEAGTIAARLARHFAEGEDHEAAARYRLQAARHAIALGAYPEAIAHASAGLQSLARLPGSAERRRPELALEFLRGTALAASKGYAAADAESAYSRVLALSRQTGDTPEATSALVGLFAFHLLRASIGPAEELATRVRALGRRTGDATHVLWGEMGLGITTLQRGDTAGARAQFETALALYDPRQRDAYLATHRQEAGVICQGYRSWYLWLLGFPDQALDADAAALAVAEESGQPLDRAHALLLSADLFYFRREPQRAVERAEAGVRLCTEYGLGPFLAPSMIALGWAHASLGDSARGIAEMREGLAAWQALGAGYALPLLLAMLGEALGRAGRTEEALETLAAALGVAEKTGERFWEPEVHRLRGEILARAAASEATDALRHALDLARVQHAPSLELRAATGLCRLARRGDERDRARTRLADLYVQFAEGLDTLDLCEARRLLS